jgi:cysteine desulfuration protein SufE
LRYDEIMMQPLLESNMPMTQELTPSDDTFTTLLAQRTDELAAPFEALAGWDERYQHLIALGKAHPAIDASLQVDKYKVQGCQSQVWLHAHLNDAGLMVYQADSDALIVRGLVALLMAFYNELPPKVVMKAEPTLLNRLGLTENLSMQRNNGLAAMIKQIKLYAMALHLKSQQA